jgi:5-methylcytosine-specific restriction endonuclease McrA
MYDLPKSRNEARELSVKAYFTGLFCKQGHLSKRWVATGNCAECQKKRTRDWIKANPEKTNKTAQKYRDSDKGKLYWKQYYENHKLYYLIKDANRRSLKLQATTGWGQEKVEDFYIKAKEMEKLNPMIKYHVDHIVPLQGLNVCGLHNHFNLQILTETENKKKSRKWN